MHLVTDPPIKIIVTDDHSLFRTGVINSLKKKPDIVVIAEAVHGKDLLEKLEYLQPDIILLNIMMPVMDGYTTLPILKKRFPGIKVIILSMHSDPSVICRMIELGANAYLTKEAGSEKIYETIFACHKDWFFINETIAEAFAKYLEERPANQPYRFTDKELAILKLIQQGKTFVDIGKTVDLSPRTVAAIVDKLKTRTGCKSTRSLLHFAINEKIISPLPVHKKILKWFS